VLLTAFILFLASMFAMSRMWAPAAAYAAVAGASFAFQARRLPKKPTAITYPLSPPDWLEHPYTTTSRCYGCGLEPEIMKPREWVLCFWCNELRIAIESRPRVSLLGV
jgi:hypothetical protein